MPDTPLEQLEYALVTVRSAANLIAADNNALRDERAALLLQRDKLAAEVADLRQKLVQPVQPAEVPYVPGMTLETGRTYRIAPGTELEERVTVPGVTFTGGPCYPGRKDAFKVLADGVTFEGVRFDTDRTDPKKLNIGACVLTYAARTTVRNCTADDVDSFVKAGVGASDLVIENCTGTDRLRSHFVYLAGVAGALIHKCKAPDSRTENLVRLTRAGTAISSNVVIKDCDFGNPGKAVIDARQVRGLTVIKNRLTGDPGGTAIRVGPHQSVGRDASHLWEVADDVVVSDNDCIRGAIQVYPGGTGITVTGNRGHDFRGRHRLPDGKTFNGESFVTVSGHRDFIPEARLKNVALLGNVMHLSVGEPNSIEPCVIVRDGDKIAGLLVGENPTVPVPTSIAPVSQ